MHIHEFNCEIKIAQGDFNTHITTTNNNYDGHNLGNLFKRKRNYY